MVSYVLSIGILGMGSIGGIVAGHMQAFGAKVVYHNRNKLPQDCESRELRQSNAFIAYW